MVLVSKVGPCTVHLFINSGSTCNLKKQIALSHNMKVLFTIFSEFCGANHSSDVKGVFSVPHKSVYATARLIVHFCLARCMVSIRLGVIEAF